SEGFRTARNKKPASCRERVAACDPEGLGSGGVRHHRSGEQHKDYKGNKGEQGHSGRPRRRQRDRPGGALAVRNAEGVRHVEIPVVPHNNHAALRCTMAKRKNLAETTVRSPLNGKNAPFAVSAFRR